MMRSVLGDTVNFEIEVAINMTMMLFWAVYKTMVGESRLVEALTGTLIR